MENLLLTLLLIQIYRFFSLFDFLYIFIIFREELLKQQKLARKEKKAVGKTLKDFEDEFYAETGRYVA